MGRGLMSQVRTVLDLSRVTTSKEASVKNYPILLMPIALLSIVLACSSAGNRLDGVGEARMEIRQVPPGVGCLRVIAAATRTVQQDFNVSPGISSILNLTG